MIYNTWDEAVEHAAEVAVKLIKDDGIHRIEVVKNLDGSIEVTAGRLVQHENRKFEVKINI